MSDPASGPAEALFPGGVVDAHHHLYERPGLRYLIDDYIADQRSAGLDVFASIYIQARSGYLQEGPEPFRVWGETEFAVAAAKCAEEAGHPGLCAGIVGAADLTLARGVAGVLEGHLERAGHAGEGGRFCGIRHILAWDADARLLNPAYPTHEHLMEQPDFLAGFAVLGELGLSFDAWLLAPQLPRLIRLAERFADVPIILNHCGGPVGTGPYAGRGAAMFEQWAQDMARLAECSNVCVKFGGLGMALCGLLHPPDPAGLAALWRPWFEHILAEFGPQRMMLGSNAPADRPGYPFHWGWRAFQQLIAPLDVDTRCALARETALRVYQLHGRRASPPPRMDDRRIQDPLTKMNGRKQP